LKQLTPVRLLANGFSAAVREAEARGATPEELKALLGRGRAKRGMFEGDLEEGELEIGQISALLDGIVPAGDLVRTLASDYRRLTAGMQDPRFVW
jgi:enoyl-[acyl-carrier protein] reductase II